MTYVSLSDPLSGKQLDILDIHIRLGTLEKSSIAMFWKFNGNIHTVRKCENWNLDYIGVQIYTAAITTNNTS